MLQKITDRVNEGGVAYPLYNSSKAYDDIHGYDAMNEILFLGNTDPSRGRDGRKFHFVDFLQKDSDGQFRIVYSSSYSGRAALINKISSSSEPEDEKQDDPKEEETTITTPELPTIDTTSKDVQDNIKNTLGITDSTPQFETISKDSSIMSKNEGFGVLVFAFLAASLLRRR